VFLISIFSQFELAAQKNAIKVACIGDSVTAGYLLSDAVKIAGELQFVKG
jgi:sialate O-acetylesterase